MLVSLNVKNLALIDAAEVNFTEGLNILSGETGAGKSIIIGSVNLALGAKADKDLIRTGAEYALIELIFESKEADIVAKMEELDIPVEEDGSIIIARRIQPNRSTFKCNGETVTARQIKELSELLLDIHGQHEHQSLLHKLKHLEILDGYAGATLATILKDISDSYKKLHQMEKELKTMSGDEESRLRELELAAFEVQEIEESDLKIGEDIDLDKQYQLMSNSRKIMEGVSAAFNATSWENEESACNQTGRAVRELNSVSSYDENLQELAGQLNEIDNLLNDFNRALSDYMESLEFDEEDFAQVEERLNILNHLKAKYGRTLEEVLAYKEKREQTRDRLEHFDQMKENLTVEITKEKETLLMLCEKASRLRSETAAELSEKLKAALLDLNFLHVEFQIQVRPDCEVITSLGYDDVEFMISTNPGEPLKPLHMIASGGELSRIMLALKTVLADRDAIESLIFDEIDTGISGKTAWRVAEKLGMLSRKHQVICITHLPQIAAMADEHFFIEKITDGNVTKTMISRMDEEQRMKELARMLGSDTLSSAALENARELIDTAQKAKGKI